MMGRMGAVERRREPGADAGHPQHLSLVEGQSTIMFFLGAPNKTDIGPAGRDTGWLYVRSLFVQHDRQPERPTRK
jgi:hypothetical protein